MPQTGHLSVFAALRGFGSSANAREHERRTAAIRVIRKTFMVPPQLI
jgi:hypothetical protein